jgi:predicted P-loop ATPase
MTLGDLDSRTQPCSGDDYKPSLDKASGFDASEAKRFLKLLGKDRAETWLRAIDPVKARKRSGGADHQGVASKADKAWIDAKTADGFNLYAITGNAAAIKGTSVKDADITGCPALFVEWDDGAAIDIQAQRWSALELPEPTLMVATGGKSVHCYWVLREPMAPEPWRVLQSRLITYCKGDEQCKNPSRLMRLPGSIYYDKKTGEPTGQCRIIAAIDDRYAAFDLEACLPSPAPAKPVAAAPKGQWEPRGIDEINAAAEYIPRRVGGEGTYESDLHALCGCSAALAEAGHPDPDGAALALLGHLWPSEAEARQVLGSADTRNAASFWAIAGQHGYDLKRTSKTAKTVKATPAEPGTGNAVRLKPNQVLELLPNRVGTLRLNIRSRDVHTKTGTLNVNEAQLLYLKLSSNAETWGKEVTADAVAFISIENSFDPVADFLNDTGNELPMEQWQRLDQHLLGINDPIAAEFLPRYLIGAVARVFKPGCDVRQTPVLVGPQWRGKTALGRILFGAEHWISGVGDLGKESQMKCHTAWGIELAELDGVTRRSDQESLKAFLTETCDSIRRPYDKGFVRHPRRFVFWGTSNGAALRDTTGNTRYVTIPIPDQMLPLEWAQRHRNALWARAVEQYKAGVDWNQCSEAIRNAIADRNDNFTELDPWHDRIAQVLKRKALELQIPVKVSDLLEAVEVPIDRQRTTEGQRVRRIAESLGWLMERRQSGAERRRGLWPAVPQVPQAVPQDCHKAETSDGNGFGTAATSATTKPKELDKRGEQQQPQQQHQAPQQCHLDTVGANLVALMAETPNPSDGKGSALVAEGDPLMARLVAPVSPRTVSGRQADEQRIRELGHSADLSGWSDEELPGLLQSLEAAHIRRAAAAGIAIPEAA